MRAVYPMRLRLGVRWIAHRRPSHRWPASIGRPPMTRPRWRPSVTCTTRPATRSAARGLACGRFATVPRSSRGRVLSLNAGVRARRAPRVSSPTAMQNLAEAHETPARVNTAVPGWARGSARGAGVRPSQPAATLPAPRRRRPDRLAKARRDAGQMPRSDRPGSIAHPRARPLILRLSERLEDCGTGAADCGFRDGRASGSCGEPAPSGSRAGAAVECCLGERCRRSPAAREPGSPGR